MSHRPPRTLMAQLARLVLVAFVAAQGLALWLFADERAAAIRAAQQAEVIERAAVVLAAFETAPPESRAAILTAANGRLVRFSADPAPLVATSNAPTLAAQLAPRLGTGQEFHLAQVLLTRQGTPRADPPAALGWLRARMLAAGIAPVELRIAMRLEAGGWLNLRAEFPRPEVPLPPVILASALLSLALILAALWLGLRRITAPLRRLALAADGFGLDAPPPVMPQEGPREVQALAEALSRMQARLGAMIGARTQMLAALGHDLRSPITALRLRAEMVEDDETRERMVATLEEMQEMVEATLAYARGVSPDQPFERVDLAGMLADLVAELAVQGPGLRLAPAAPLLAEARRTPLRRALRNLLENAQRYGGGGQVRLQAAEGMAEIVIEDRGPGIPPADLERVFDPFVRLETSRSRETGGTGLGLSIARAIVAAQGGTLALENRAGGGLRAVLRLPLSQPGRGSGGGPQPETSAASSR